MKVRAKFYVSKVSEFGNQGTGRANIYKHTPKEGGGWTSENTGIPCREITLQAVYDDGISKENASFSEATPQGSMTFYLSNLACADEFKPGDIYYIEMFKA